MKASTYFILCIPLLILNCNKSDHDPSTDPPIDADGYEYKIITIGNQVWMAENLRTTKYNNRDEIGTTVPASLDISHEYQPKYQWPFSGNERTALEYGRLYTWYAITDDRGVCPSGWHVPSDVDWAILCEFLGGFAISGAKLKETGTAHWHNPNEGATNESGFTAIPSGYRRTSGDFDAIGLRERWWSAAESSTTHAWRLGVDYNSIELSRSDQYSKFGGYSVRCLKND